MAITAEQGTTVRIPATYRNAAGSLVDPVSPEVELRNPSNVVTLTAVPTQEDVGEYYYDWAVGAGEITGSWVARFSGTIDGLLVFGDELVAVVEPGFVAGNLLTLSEYRDALGKDPTDTRDDDKFNTLAPFMSDAIRAFTERDFGVPILTEERVFEYDGSGYLDIDDASVVQSVAYAYPNSGVGDMVLSSDAWTPRPQRRDDAPIFYYIAISGGWAFGGISPEMGFERNLDVWVREHGFAGGGGQVKVNATWGWPTIPGAVKMAAIWTMQAWLSRPQGQGLTAEAIEGWSRSWGSGTGGATPRLAIPDEARDLLVQFSKGI